ncbi:MAG: sigma factor-like helix-turn-helix DNA-binding protein, partial [Bacteroidota bacterium]
EHIELQAKEELARIELQDKGSTLSEQQEDQLEQIKRKMKLLPPVTSKVFNLYAIDGYKHCEIASLLNISEGTSQWHYSMAKKKIKEMIQADQALLKERAS